MAEGKDSSEKPRFFATAAAFRAWLAKHHDEASELVVGFYKKGSGRPSITWPESVDQALCFGWIDGKRKSLGDEAYTIRFTPRRPTSMWSAVNVAKVAELEQAGLMTEAGRKAFEKMKENRSGLYSYEQRPRELPESYRKRLDAKKRAAAHFDGRPPSYRRAAIWWVLSAKREETRLRRLEALIDHHGRGELIPPLAPRR